MKTNFDLSLDERDDKTRVWAARCLACDATIVGELYPQVTVVRLKGSIPASQFAALKLSVKESWDKARQTGNPILVADDRLTIGPAIDPTDMQRALEAHVVSCPAKRELLR